MRNGLDLERSCKLMGSKLLGVKTFLEVHDFLFRIKKIVLNVVGIDVFNMIIENLQQVLISIPFIQSKEP